MQAAALRLILAIPLMAAAAQAPDAAAQAMRRTAAEAPAAAAGEPRGRSDADVSTSVAMDDDGVSSPVLRRNRALEDARPRGRAEQGQVGADGVIRRPDPGTGRVQPQPPTYKREHQDAPKMSPEAQPSSYDPAAFGRDPDYGPQKYDAKAQLEIYGGKSRVNGPRPPVEWGYPLYSEGPLPDSINLFGDKNPARPQLLVYGDWRTAVAWNDLGNKETGQIATRLNVDIDLKLTSTERVHMLLRPLDSGKRGQFLNYEFFGDDRAQGTRILDGNIETLFFEGDLGAIVAGFSDKYNSYDIPITFGLVPLLFQNGIWVDDAFVGGAFTIPARNSKLFDISNMDFTFFAGFDRVTTNAIKDPVLNKQDDASAQIFGMAAFFDVLEGYLELGYGFTKDTRGTGFNFDYHNATVGFTRRYGGWLSNSVRAIWNFGQEPDRRQRQTADGVVLLVENSLITHLPSTLVPYFNAFIGRDRPQSLVRDFGAGGVLKNTGINFETDGLTGFPKLDDSANDTFGGAIGVQYLFDLNQQLVFEAATNQVIGGDFKPGRAAKSDEYALGVRYQVPLTMAWIFRTDLIHAWRSADKELSGIRFEMRRKF